MLFSLMIAESAMAGFSIVDSGTFGGSLNVTGWPAPPAPSAVTISSGSFGGALYMNNKPVISSPSPANNSNNQATSLSWSCTIEDPEGDSFNWTLAGSNGQSNNANDATNGSKSLSLSGLSASTTYTVWVNVTDGLLWTREWFNFSTVPPGETPVTLSSGSFGGELYIEYYVNGNWSDWWYLDSAPADFIYPTGFQVANLNDTQLNVSWTKGANATHTYIRRKVGSAPQNRTDGALAYNDTASAFDDTNLSEGTNYNYSAWSYNSTINRFSNNYIFADNCTKPGNLSYLHYTDATMTAITLAWNTGANATATVIIMNESGWTDYPTTQTNGTEVFNSSGSSIEIGTLTANTTYYFTAWAFLDCGSNHYFSIANETVNESTLASADAPSSLTAETQSNESIWLNWTKGTIGDYTIVRRQIGSYPTNSTGDVVYSSTAETYTDTGLTPAAHYYYRAWGYNGFEYSAGYASAHNVTLPSPPEDFMGTIDGTTLTITWTAGAGADQTVVRNETAAYPANVTAGYLVYNGTNEITVVSGVTDIDYYRGWSYVLIDTMHLYSEGTNLLWGGLEVNCYNESNASQNVTFDLFITNKEHTETYLQEGCTNPTRIDVADVPNGENITIQISATDYETRAYVIDLFENQWKVLNAFLPLALPPGGTTDPDYDPTNQTYAHTYFLVVYDEFDNPIEDAEITIKRALNLSGTLEYQDVAIIQTDASGSATVSLLPGTLYGVTIVKDGYDSAEEEYEPDEDYYGIYYPKIFRLRETPTVPVTNTFTDLCNLYISWVSSNESIRVTFLCKSGTATATTFKIYEIYNGSLALNTTQSFTSDNNIIFYLEGANTSREHVVMLDMTHSTLGSVENESRYLSPLRDFVIDTNWLENQLTAALGENPLGWVDLFIIYGGMMIILLALAGAKQPGLAIIGAGAYAMLITTLTDTSLSTKLEIMISLLIVLGFLTLLIKFMRGRHK